jgi:SAM-dependent methyltransferase
VKEASEARVAETWDSFWGHLLLWRFHEDNPERWSAREDKADWLIKTLELRPAARVLDLACGDGLLSICLARKGCEVTALDRVAPVLDAARKEADARGVRVDFIAADMRTHDFGGHVFDGVVFFDTLGLIGRTSEAALFDRLRGSLSKGARIALDWPREPGEASWEREFPDGTLQVSASYDANTRLQTIEPEFHRADGTVIELHDPYAPPDHRGIRRYIYPLEEAKALLAEVGYEAEEVPHYRRPDYRMLLAGPHAVESVR